MAFGFICYTAIFISSLFVNWDTFHRHLIQVKSLILTLGKNMISHTNIIWANMQKYKTNGHKTIDAGTEMMNNMPNRIIFDNNKDTQKSKEKETERSKHHLYNGKRALRIQRKYNSHPMMLLFFFYPLFSKKKRIILK